MGSILEKIEQALKDMLIGWIESNLTNMFTDVNEKVGTIAAAWLRLQKMHGAAELLRSTDRTVLDIAGQFGYDNASKFARTFRDVIGVSPNEYRSGVDQDSCAPV